MNLKINRTSASRWAQLLFLAAMVLLSFGIAPLADVPATLFWLETQTTIFGQGRPVGSFWWEVTNMMIDTLRPLARFGGNP